MLYFHRKTTRQIKSIVSRWNPYFFISNIERIFIYGFHSIGRLCEYHQAPIYEIMSKPVLSVNSDMPIPYAARFLTNFNVSYAMVIENNEVIGMVSLNGMVNNWED